MSETYVVTGTGTNAKSTITKDPNAVLDYTFDWTLWLDDITDSISTHTIVPETGIVCDSSTISGKTVIAWISGGTDGTTYRVACRIVTTGGRTEDRSIFIKVKER
jgi:hypothetical protein